MEQLLELIRSLQNIILNPDLGGAVSLFLVSAVNEITGIFPLAVVLSGQLAFLEGPMPSGFIIKTIFFVVVPVAVGSALGTLPVYVLAYYGGRRAVNYLGRYLHLDWQDVERVSARFRGEWYDEIIFLIFRSMPFMPALPINIAAGILRYNFVSYLILTLIGFSLRMILTLILIGFGIVSLSKLLIFIYNI